MTSKLTSHSLCTRHSDAGDYDFGGVCVKSCCGNVRLNKTKQGEIWINGVFCDNEFLANNYGNGFQTSTESCRNEHSEVDWISKEIAFQELICNERSNHWLDSSNGRTDYVKEEHDIDIISTLTAVAALFRDWCAVETDVSETRIEEMPHNMRIDTDDDCVWVDPKGKSNKSKGPATDLPLQNEVLGWSNYAITWDQYVEDHLKNQGLLSSSFMLNESSNKDFTKVTAWSSEHVPFKEENKCQDFMNSRNDLHSMEDNTPPQRHKGVISESGVSDQFGTSRVAAGDQSHSDNLEPLVDIDRYVMFGSQNPTTSRYSFGRECGLGSTSGARESDSLKDDLLNRISYNEQILAADECLCSSSCESTDINKDVKTNQPTTHEALFYALSYMSLPDLLTMEGVCRSLRDWVRNDVLLWQQLQIEPPLSKNFTDEVLLKLSSRSKGQLQSLTLVDCTRVTEDTVERVVSSNPKLAKLALPGCSRISADAVVRMVDILASHRHHGMPGLKQLRVRNIYGLTGSHLENLQNMVGIVSMDCSTSRKPQYYHNGHASSCDDERAIDVEECPMCRNVRIVYDCTRERCQQRQGMRVPECRGCILCIVRCEECGRCINDNEYEETFSLDLLCSSCWLRLPKCAECNRPGCGRHADHFIRTPESTYVCSDCSLIAGANCPGVHPYG